MATFAGCTTSNAGQPKIAQAVGAQGGTCSEAEGRHDRLHRRSDHPEGDVVRKHEDGVAHVVGEENGCPWQFDEQSHAKRSAQGGT